MAKIVHENEPIVGGFERDLSFGSGSDSADPSERLRELEGIVASQRAALESVRREMEETQSAMDKSLAYAAKMTSEADDAIRAKSQFLRNISHELRTPMNSILGMTRLLLETGLTEEQAEFAEIVQASAGELMSIINDILDLSRIESRSLVIADEPFDLADTLDCVLETVGFAAREKALYVDLVCESAVPTRLKGDAGRIRQVLGNLLGNAVKFTERGRVDVRVTLDSETEETAQIRFTVRDTGVGIPEGAETAIFESFTTGDSSNTRRYGGAGLGLAISKEVLKAMDGEIGGRNLPNGGAEFHFSLPLRKQVDAHASWQEFLSLAGRRALVFGPEKSSNDATVAMLEEVGVQVVRADMPNALITAAKNAEGADEKFDFAIFATDAAAEAVGMFEGGLEHHPAFAKTRFVGVYSPGHRPSLPSTRRSFFSSCLERPLRQLSLYRALKNAEDIFTRSERRSRPGRLAGGNTPRILLVEDHLYSQKLMVQILTRLGYRVSTASNGLHAVELLRVEMFDLVLMDIQMPVMDGLSATRIVRSGEGGVLDPDIPVVALTSHAYEEDKQLCYHAGMNDFLIKPVDPVSLKSAIDTFFSDTVSL